MKNSIPLRHFRLPLMVLICTLFCHTTYALYFTFSNIPANGQRDIVLFSDPSLSLGVNFDNFDVNVAVPPSGSYDYFLYVEYLDGGTWKRADADGIITVARYQEKLHNHSLGGVSRIYSPTQWVYKKAGVYTFRVAVYISYVDRIFSNGATFPVLFDESSTFNIEVLPEPLPVLINGVAPPSSVTVERGKTLRLQVSDENTEVRYRINGGIWQTIVGPGSKSAGSKVASGKSLGARGTSRKNRKLRWDTDQISDCAYKAEFQVTSFNGAGASAIGPISQVNVTAPATTSLGSGGYSLSGTSVCNNPGAKINLKIDGQVGVPQWYYRINGGAWSALWSTFANPVWNVNTFGGAYAIQFRCDVASTDASGGDPCHISTGTPFTVSVNTNQPLSLGSGGHTTNGYAFCNRPGSAVNLFIHSHVGTPKWFYQINNGGWVHFSDLPNPTWDANRLRGGDYTVNFRCDVVQGSCGDAIISGTPFRVDVAGAATIGKIQLRDDATFCKGPNDKINLSVSRFTGDLRWEYKVLGGSWKLIGTRDNEVWNPNNILGDYSIRFRVRATTNSASCGSITETSEVVRVNVTNEGCGFWERDNATYCEGQSIDASFRIVDDEIGTAPGYEVLPPESNIFFWPYLYMENLTSGGPYPLGDIFVNGKEYGSGNYNWRLAFSENSNTPERRRVRIGARADGGLPGSAFGIEASGAASWSIPPIRINILRNADAGFITSSLPNTVCGDIGHTANFSLNDYSGNPTWYYRLNGGSPNQFASGPNATLNIAPGNNSYSVFARVHHTRCGGKDRSESFVIETVTSPQLGTDAFANVSSVCGGQSAVLEVRNHAGDPSWYYRRGQTGAWTLLASNTSQVVWTSPQVNDLFQFRVDISGPNYCGGGSTISGQPVTINVSSPPAPAVVDFDAVCIGSAATLEVENPESFGIYRWYNAAGALLTSGRTFTTTALNITTRYWVSHIVNGCEGPRLAVDVPVLNPPTPSLNPAGTVCSGSTPTLTVAAPDPNLSYEWFTTPTEGTLVRTGNWYTTPPLGANTTYYVQSRAGNCVSARAAVQVQITLPALPTVVGDSAVCAGSSALLRIEQPRAGATYEWYDAFSGGNHLGTGNVFTTPAIFVPTTFYAQEVVNGCVSLRGQKAITEVWPVYTPVPDEVPDFCPGRPVELSLVNPSPEASYEWYDSPTGGTLLAVGESYITDPIDFATTFYVRGVTERCESDFVPFVVNLPDPINPQCFCKENVLLVVDKLGDMDEQDVVFHQKLEQDMGYTVTLIDDTHFGPESLTEDIEWIFISNSVSSKKVVDKLDWKNLELPVFTLDVNMYPVLGMTGSYANVDYGTVGNFDQIENTAPLHPIMTGMPSVVDIMSNRRRLTFGQAEPASILATVDGGNYGAVIAYEQTTFGPSGDQIIQHPWKVSSERQNAEFKLVELGTPGDYSLEIKKGRGASTAVQQTVPIYEGETYTVSFRAWSTRASSLSVTFQQNAWPFGRKSFRVQTSGSGWDTFGPFTYKAAETDTVQQFIINVTRGADPVAIDDIVLLDEMGVNLVQNGDFQNNGPTLMAERRLGLPLPLDHTAYLPEMWRIFENAVLWTSNCVEAPSSSDLLRSAVVQEEEPSESNAVETADVFDESAVDDIAVDGLINIYPNPSKTVFTATIDGHVIRKLSMINQLGQTIEISYSGENTTHVQVQIPALSRGIYYLIAEDGEGHLHRGKVLITN